MPSLLSLDRKIKAAEKELTALGLERGSTLLELTGISPIGAARLLADVRDLHRFRDKGRFAWWNGTAPLDAFSGATDTTGSLVPATARSTARCTSWLTCRCVTAPRGGSSSTTAGSVGRHR